MTALYNVNAGSSVMCVVDAWSVNDRSPAVNHKGLSHTNISKADIVMCYLMI